MKNLLVLGLILSSLQAFAGQTYEGSSFNDVWKQIQSDEYDRLPQYEVSYGSLSSWTTNYIKQAALRTLNSHEDIIPEFTKLAHPNGTCLRGTWEIDTDNEYTGLYKKGTKSLIIVRASTALSETKVGDKRAFGFAGKIFPTLDEETSEKVKTANFFLVDDLGGTDASHYTGVELTNEPPVSKNSTILRNFLYIVKLMKTFAGVDKNPGVRQLYEISEMNKGVDEIAVTPKWMMVRARKGTEKINERDFRNELNIYNYSEGLVFDIFVANIENSTGGKNWNKIGKISFEESVSSKSCDRRLHFHHPKWRNDLKHSHYEAYKTFYDQQAYEAQRMLENWL